LKLQVDFVVVEKISASSGSAAATMYLKTGIPPWLFKESFCLLLLAAVLLLLLLSISIDIARLQTIA